MDELQKSPENSNLAVDSAVDLSSSLSKPIANWKITSPGMVRSVRDVRPAHYMLKIKSYSLLAATGVEKYESGVFEVGGYSWRLIVYPNGRKSISEEGGHISLALQIVEVEKLSLGWEVLVSFKFFVHDQICDKYLTIQSVNCTGKSECLSMVKEPNNGTYTWTIKPFSEVENKNVHESELFVVGGKNWNIELYPKGDATEKGKSLSVFLRLVDLESLAPNRKLYAEFKFRIRRQFGKNYETTGKSWFGGSNISWGFSKTLSLADLKNVSKSYIYNDTLVVEVEFIVLSVIEDFK
ncbi:putative TRAF-like family protein [Quillaja saponaria]|uniref:TRAF-like family protein n=1 Tax=Quillaja saponaria TaxID=32244 RepID=A0AAD7L3D6_QUISA|nr:putative TRAF-like family protein [Quillaja saponaria]